MNEIRRGTVTGINYKEGTVNIVQEDQDDVVSFELPLLSFEFNPPAVGDMVLAVYLSNDSSQGFIIGTPFNHNNLPKRGEKNVIRKEYDIDAYVEYDKQTKTLTIQAEHIVVKGNVVQDGGI